VWHNTVRYQQRVLHNMLRGAAPSSGWNVTPHTVNGVVSSSSTWKTKLGTSPPPVDRSSFRTREVHSLL